MESCNTMGTVLIIHSVVSVYLASASIVLLEILQHDSISTWEELSSCSLAMAAFMSSLYFVQWWIILPKLSKPRLWVSSNLPMVQGSNVYTLVFEIWGPAVSGRNLTLDVYADIVQERAMEMKGLIRDDWRGLFYFDGLSWLAKVNIYRENSEH